MNTTVQSTNFWLLLALCWGNKVWSKTLLEYGHYLILNDSKLWRSQAIKYEGTCIHNYSNNLNFVSYNYNLVSSGGKRKLVHPLIPRFRLFHKHFCFLLTIVHPLNKWSRFALILSKNLKTKCLITIFCNVI